MAFHRIARGVASCEDILARRGPAPLSLAPALDYARARPAFLDARLMPPEAEAHLRGHLARTHEPGRPIDLLDLPDASVFGQGSVILADGRLLLDAAAEFLNHGSAPEGSEARGDGYAVAAPAYRRLGGRTLLVKRPWYRNFGHWLIDLLPLLPLAARAGARVDTILFGDVPASPIRAMMEEAAARSFPEAARLFADDHTLCDAEHLLYARPVHVPPLFKHPAAVAELRAYALATAPPDAGGPRRRLFIDRGDVSGRDIGNMAALRPVLDRFGVEAVRPDRLGFPEQVALFREAELVVGIKGAAFVTAVACAPGSAALMLSPDAFWDPFFWDLLTPLGIRYGEIYGRTLPDGFQTVSRCRFTVEPEALAAGLRAMGFAER